MSVRSAIQYRMEQSAELTALVGERIWHRRRPQVNTSLPAVIFTVDTEPTDQTITGPSGVRWADVTITVLAQDEADTEPVCEVLLALWDGFRGSIEYAPGHQVSFGQFSHDEADEEAEDPDDDSDSELSKQSLKFKAGYYATPVQLAPGPIAPPPGSTAMGPTPAPTGVYGPSGTSLRKAIQYRLQQDTVLAQAVGTRIWFNRRPQTNQALPAITFSVDAEPADPHLLGSSSVRWADVKFSVYAVDEESAHPIAERVAAIWDGFRGSIQYALGEFCSIGQFSRDDFSLSYSEWDDSDEGVEVLSLPFKVGYYTTPTLIIGGEIVAPTMPLGVTGPRGETGVSGVTGVQGVTGPIGPTGSQGDTGARGETGVQGHTGIQGIQGIQGDTGVQGQTGVQGSTGVPGQTGLAGPVGDTGVRGETGSQGQTGPRGETGYQGSTGSQGQTGYQGSTGVQGDTGPRGLTGLVGSTGVQGQTGVRGFTGVDGDTGVRGQTGTGGPTGAVGSTGVQGQTGSRGETGAQGVAGSTGVQGFTGAVGGTGVQGGTGLGVTGPVGGTGLPGPVGETGAQGQTGVQGFTGLFGVQGQTGVQGIQGLRGNTGLQGDRGPTGPQGATGTPGTTAGVIYYLDDSASGVSNYHSLLTSPNAIPEEIDAVSVPKGQTVLIDSYATPNAVGLSVWNGGQWEFNLWGEGTGAACTILVEVYQRTAAGTEILLGSAESPNLPGLVGAEPTICYLVLPDTQVSESDRLVVKFSGKNNGIPPLSETISLRHNGTQFYSHCHSPFTILGAQGSTGIQGLTGLSGVGSTGLQGVTGLAGVGSTGPQGITGLRGLTGLSGVGSTGLQGGTGLQGVTGLAGVGSTGPQGITGSGDLSQAVILAPAASTRNVIRGTGPSIKSLVIQGATGQSVALQEWQDPDGGVVAIMSVGGALQVAQMGVGGFSSSYALAVATSTVARGINVNQTIASGVAYGGVINAVGAATTNIGLSVNASGATANTAIACAGTQYGLQATGRVLITGNADAVQLIVKANSSQSASLQEWQNSSGTALAGFNSAGILWAAGTTGLLTQGATGIRGMTGLAGAQGQTGIQGATGAGSAISRTNVNGSPWAVSQADQLLACTSGGTVLLQLPALSNGQIARFIVVDEQGTAGTNPISAVAATGTQYLATNYGSANISSTPGVLVNSAYGACELEGIGTLTGIYWYLYSRNIGLQGAQGATGLAGLSGQTGPVGPTGIVGATGVGTFITPGATGLLQYSTGTSIVGGDKAYYGWTGTGVIGVNKYPSYPVDVLGTTMARGLMVAMGTTGPGAISYGAHISNAALKALSYDNYGMQVSASGSPATNYAARFLASGTPGGAIGVQVDVSGNANSNKSMVVNNTSTGNIAYGIEITCTTAGFTNYGVKSTVGAASNNDYAFHATCGAGAVGGYGLYSVGRVHAESHRYDRVALEIKGATGQFGTALLEAQNPAGAVVASMSPQGSLQIGATGIQGATGLAQLAIHQGVATMMTGGAYPPALQITGNWATPNTYDAIRIDIANVNAQYRGDLIDCYVNGGQVFLVQSNGYGWLYGLNISNLISESSIPLRVAANSAQTADLLQIVNSGASLQCGIDAAFRAWGTMSRAVCGGRLTASSTEPAPTGSVTGSATLYFLPFGQSEGFITLWDGTRYRDWSFSSASISLTGLTANRLYDVFLYEGPGSISNALNIWTNDTTRGTAISRDGDYWYQTGDQTKRYVGTIRINATGGQVDDGPRDRCIFNMHNRVPRVATFTPGTGSYNWVNPGGTLTAWRLPNNGAGAFAGPHVKVVVGDPQGLPSYWQAQQRASSNAATMGFGTTVMIDGGTATQTQPTYNYSGGMNSAFDLTISCGAAVVLAPGYRFVDYREAAVGTGTLSIVGDGMANRLNAVLEM